MIEDKKHITELNLEDYERGKLHKVWFDLISDPFGNPVSIPLLIGRGTHPGPVLGMTAALHGDELNGISVIQRLMRELEEDELKGTILAVPVLNSIAYFGMERRFMDGVDLNHIMPGDKEGRSSDHYAWKVFDGIIKHMDYLLDLHTASRGRINSYYVRADMEQDITKNLALLQNARIIVHNPPNDGTLRGAAEDRGIAAITLEVGNPSLFQKKLIRSGVEGVHNVLIHLGMVEGEIENAEYETVICEKSYWIYTDMGGQLTVIPELATMVEKGQQIATLRNVFGEIIKEYFAPEDGIVIGKSVNPVNFSGGRILHLGIIK